MKVGSWNERNKGLWAFTECLRLGTDNKGYKPGLEAFKGFLLATCFWEQGLLFPDKTPFRVSPKLCYGLGGGLCVLCLNALMFIWNGYVQVCLMLYSLKIIKLHNWIINFVSPLEAVPECPFQSVVLRALHLCLYISFSLSLPRDSLTLGEAVSQTVGSPMENPTCDA